MDKFTCLEPQSSHLGSNTRIIERISTTYLITLLTFTTGLSYSSQFNSVVVTLTGTGTEIADSLLHPVSSPHSPSKSNPHFSVLTCTPFSYPCQIRDSLSHYITALPVLENHRRAKPTAWLNSTPLIQLEKHVFDSLSIHVLAWF